MKTIAHLSDLHFNRIDPKIAAAAKAWVIELNPELIIISGDLTQRAQAEEFRAFTDFMGELPQRKLIVPGNHDIPLYAFAERWLMPFRRFKKYIQSELSPNFVDDEIFVLGVNSVQPYAVQGGHLPRKILENIERTFAAVPPEKLRVLVLHHPIRSQEGTSADWVQGIEKVNTRIDLILSGHLHRAESEVFAIRREVSKATNASTLLVRAGTAFSTRQRGEPNSFNVIRVDGNAVEIEVRRWEESARAFAISRTSRFRRGDLDWN